jgi:Uncharacterized protein conserved in bacteria
MSILDTIFNKLAIECSKREYCVSQLEDKLRKVIKKNEEFIIDEKDVGSIIERLKSENYLSNKRFAEAYVNDKLLFNGWGRHKIVFGLRYLKIEEEYINEAINEKYREKSASIVEKLMRAKYKSLRNIDAELAKQKTIKYMLNKGFDYEEVYSKLFIFA